MKVGTLFNRIAPADGARGARKITMTQVVEGASRYKAGETLEAIAKSFGVSTSGLQYELKKNGVKMRRAGRKKATPKKQDNP